jgi:hypothetical protein
MELRLRMLLPKPEVEELSAMAAMIPVAVTAMMGWGSMIHAAG